MAGPGADIVVFLVGIVWAIVRRYIQRPYRIRIKTKPEDAMILGTFAAARDHRLLHRGRAASRSSAGPTSRSGRSSATRSRRSSTAGRPRRCSDAHRWLWGVHVVVVPRVPRDPADHEAAPHVHVAHEHVPEGQGPPEGRDEADAEPHGDRARDVRRVGDRGLHVEAAVRHRRVHDLRTLHVGVPRARDRQAARPARDRVEGRRGDGRDGHAAGVAAGRHRSPTSRSAPTRCSSASRPKSCGRARRARRATRSARSTSRSSTRSSTCGATRR